MDTKVTEVKVTKIEKKGNLIGFANIVLDDGFAVGGLKLIETDKGRFVGMPSRKSANGRFWDICHPINQKVRDLITNEVFEEYDKIEKQEK